MDIKVLGPGCPKCKEAVEKITDFQQMMQYGVMSTPAVVLDGVVKVVGRVPSKAEVLAWITR